MTRNQRREAWSGNLAALSVAPGLVIIFAGGLTLAAQIIGWLKTGRWTSHALYEPLHKNLGLNYPHPSWWAARKLVDFVLNLPASISLVLIGFALALFCGIVASFPLHWLGLLGSPEEAKSVDGKVD